MDTALKTVEGIEVPNAPVSATSENPPAVATTTSEQDLHSASQRQVNLIWEHTQAVIAMVVVIATMFTGVYLVVRGRTEAQIPSILSVGFGTVVGFYFGRTNHQNVGGTQLGR